MMMAYELDFIGVKNKTQDADAVGIRWKREDGSYVIGVYDGGIEEYGKELAKHIGTYYFSGETGSMLDFVICSHSDQDHVSGLKEILNKYSVKTLYMNRPWLYVDELKERVHDGRITKNSLIERLKEKYKYIAELEEIADEKKIEIKEIFQGDIIEQCLEVYSPKKEFYLELLAESDKTPAMNENLQTVFESIRKSMQAVIQYFKEKWEDENLREGESTSAENEMSTVICGKIGRNFLLTGDAGIRALGEAMDYADKIGKPIRDCVGFYQIPHHGGRHNLSPSVMNRMVGEIVAQGERIEKTAIASAGKDSDHPLKIVTNAFIKRGVSVVKTCGKTVHHHEGDMPEREGWSATREEEFSEDVEEW